ncbi:MAG: sulfur oxidation c-type cytochrome SoxX [Rubrivivax sp.]|nr:sulfur oxidation c-type cytochrome SoxX [Rubrivivax sp.]
MLVISLAAAAVLGATGSAVVGDGLPAALTAQPGDVQRGREIVGSRSQGMCLLCHAGPAELFADERTPGNVAASLAGVGGRFTEAQLRLRVADARRLNPQSPMPAYLRTEGLQRVAPAWQGRSLLTPQQVEDVVAFLRTLQ